MIEQFVLDDIFHTEFFLLNISGKKKKSHTVFKHFWAEFEQAGLGILHRSAHPSLTLKCLKINK